MKKQKVKKIDNHLGLGLGVYDRRAPEAEPSIIATKTALGKLTYDP